LRREYDLATALYDYAVALQGSGQIALACKSLQEALTLFQQLQLPQEQTKAETMLERLGQYAKAEPHSQQ
jgi:hypothetical protein